MDIEPRFDTYRTDFIVCPYCGHEQRDSWEWFSERNTDAEGACQACDKIFEVTQDYEVNYTSRKMPDMRMPDGH